MHKLFWEVPGQMLMLLWGSLRIPGISETAVVYGRPTADPDSSH